MASFLSKICSIYNNSEPIRAKNTAFLKAPIVPDLCLFSVEAAVAAFSQARPPGIYKGDYLKELFRRYGEEDDSPPAPALPEWCFDDDDGEVDDDGNSVSQESGPSSSGSAAGKRKKEKMKLVRRLVQFVSKCLSVVS